MRYVIIALIAIAGIGLIASSNANSNCSLTAQAGCALAQVQASDCNPTDCNPNDCPPECRRDCPTPCPLTADLDPQQQEPQAQVVETVVASSKSP